MMDENTSESMVRNKRRFRNSSRSLNETNTEERTSESGGKVIRLVFVSFGLLCIVQASLNVYLRLSLCVDNKCENVTADRDELQENYSLLVTSHQDLSKERDELKQKLQNLNSCCIEKWVNFSGASYHGSTTTLSWHDSRLYCQQRGADLIIINSREEQEFASAFKKHSWIGLTDQEREGVWKWVDGSRLDTSFWHSKEPNNYENEDCVKIQFYNQLNNWNDISCTDEQLFICEKKLFE